jgi:hypothetical protein
MATLSPLLGKDDLGVPLPCNPHRYGALFDIPRNQVLQTNEVLKAPVLMSIAEAIGHLHRCNDGVSDHFVAETLLVF